MTDKPSRFIQIAVKPDTHQLIAELSELTHRTRAGAVHAAVQDALRRERNKQDREAA